MLSDCRKAFVDSLLSGGFHVLQEALAQSSYSCSGVIEAIMFSPRLGVSDRLQNAGVQSDVGESTMQCFCDLLVLKQADDEAFVFH